MKAFQFSVVAPLFVEIYLKTQDSNTSAIC